MAATIEGGFPVVTTRNFAAGATSTVTATITTAGASRIVAILVGGSNGNAFPASISGGGLSWTSEQDQTHTGGTFASKKTCQIWTAQSSSALSSQVITATLALSTQVAVTFAVYSILGSSETGAATGSKDEAGTNAVAEVSITAEAGGSIVVMGAVCDDNSALTANANSTRDGGIEDGTLFVNPAVAKKTTATSGAGAVTVGFTQNLAFYAKAAVELLETLGASAFQTEAFQSNAFQILGGTTGAAPVTGGELESAVAADIIASAVRFVAVEMESARASDAAASSQAFIAGQSESAIASDASAGRSVLARGQDESAVAAEALSSFQRFAAGQAEAATASDACAAELAGALPVYNHGQAESATASESCAATIICAAGQAESAVAFDRAAFGLRIGAGQAESATPADAASAGMRMWAGQAEGARALDYSERNGAAPPVARRTPPNVTAWWLRHRRGGRLWSK